MHVAITSPYLRDRGITGFLDTSVIAYRLKRVESTRTGGDKSLYGMFTCMLTVLQCLKESKEKKIKNEKRSMVKHKEVGNIEEMVL